MSIKDRIFSLFRDGLFKETRSRNKNGVLRRFITPKKGMYLKTSQYFYNDWGNPTQYHVYANHRVIMNPEDGRPLVVTDEQADYLDGMWMIVDIIFDESGQLKLQYMSPTSLGWTNWMSLEEFDRRFEVVVS